MQRLVLSRVLQRAVVRAVPRVLSSSSASSWINSLDTFPRRHIGPSAADKVEMLKVVGASSLEDLMARTVPSSVALKRDLNIPPALSESEVLRELAEIGANNQVFRSYIGLGYYNALLPETIKRNIFENPGWYTQYTPYQAEISQGRLESLINYQTLICDLTAKQIANASLLDEGTAAAEAMIMCINATKKKNISMKFLIDSGVFPQTIAVVKTRAQYLGVNVEVSDFNTWDLKDKNVFGVLFQQFDSNGALHDFTDLVKEAQVNKILTVCATDLLGLVVTKPPGEYNTDIVIGNSQRFGVPLGYGGPHAAFIATSQEHARRLPGRLIGATKDSNGNVAYRLTLQTRETHVRREKATSNICTAQALLANIAAMYAVYHGPEGLKEIANRVHSLAVAFALGVETLGHEVVYKRYFDTITVKIGNSLTVDQVIANGLARKINIRNNNNGTVSVSLDETVTKKDLRDLIEIFSHTGSLPQSQFDSITFAPRNILSEFSRTSKFLQQKVFNTYHSESDFVRYAKMLENRDISLVHSMIPLGSCTMKLNSATEMSSVSWKEFGNIHPFSPQSQVKGYYKLFKDLELWLTEITGYDAFSLQSNSGAQGEFAGLLTIRAYQKEIGQGHRDVCLIPVSAHGTNPASAAVAGLKIVTVNVTSKGNIDVDDLIAKCAKHKDNLSAIMITYPSTYGVFEDNVKDICDIVHQHGGQVYLDGANMNAQVLQCRPGDCGADVSHLNLHKTFCIPHGGGGPGMGPIGVKKHLAPFLPSHPLVNTGRNGGTVSAAPFGSASILPISWSYIRMMGNQGLRDATATAILNANYMMKRLEPYYPVSFKGTHGFVAHEFIIDTRAFDAVHIGCVDIAKRLQDYGFHGPTMSWPVPNSLMIEPTESESRAELDRYVDALIAIRHEIQEVQDGKYSAEDNVLKNAPHTLQVIASDKWKHSYSRDKAAFPVAWLRQAKLWPHVGRVDDTFGDKNIMCTCDTVEAYAAAQSATD